MTIKTVPFVILIVLAGCSDTGGISDGPDEATDAATDAASAATNDAANVDPAPNASVSDAGPNLDADVVPNCDDACQTVDAVLTVGEDERRLERAYYGFSDTPDGSVEIYIEAYRGGVEGCPTQDSPTPDQTLVISGVPVPPPGEPGTVDTSAGLGVSLLDFEGIAAPVTRADTATLTWGKVSICPECTEQDDTGFVSFELEAQFGTEATLQGQLYATHCITFDRR